MLGPLYVGKWLVLRMAFSLGEMARLAASWLRFWKSWRQYNGLAVAAGNAPLHLRYFSPCLGDDRGTTPIEPVYFYQDAWAFECIVKSCPPAHVDVGSHHKFVSLLSKVVALEAVDIRPWDVTMDSVRFRQGSVLSLPYADQSLPSVSSLCVIEHIGLGRYGDPLDVDGTQKAFAELKRVTAPGGNLYVSLPIDDESRVYFNANRAFAESEVEALAAPFVIVARAYIFGNEFVTSSRQGHGVGCYHLRRPISDGSNEP
jgi:hypothetical protein